MTDAPGSPKRRHILSSFNPDFATEAENVELESGPEVTCQKKSASSRTRRRRSRSPTRTRNERESYDATQKQQNRAGHGLGDHADGRGSGDDTKDATNRPRRSRLKLKDPGSSSHRRRHRHRHRSRSRSRSRGGREGSRHDQEDGGSDTTRRHHHHDYPSSRRHRRRHHRHHRPRSPARTPDPFTEAPLDPEAAFRESLFDAMADDEGADYWAAVYGQPVHVYSNERVGPQGELERMTEDEYAAHVRQKMWEKTHAGLLEEKARREEVRRREREEGKRQRRLQRDMDESLRKGEERRQKRKWRNKWEEYERAWAGWDGRPETLPWPMMMDNAADDERSGSVRGEISEDKVKPFLMQGLRLEDTDPKTVAARLKEERVRWHPDKIQQRAGGTVDERTMRDVTAVFQIVDKLWSEMRTKDS